MAQNSFLTFIFSVIICNLHATNDYPSRIGSTHWQGCYNLTEKPYLIEGAETIAKMGSRVIKLCMTTPNKYYPWNSIWENNLSTPLSVAQTSYFAQVFGMDSFDTYILVTFSSLGWDYWRSGVNQSQYDTEEQEFYEVALYLLQNFVSKYNKTFIFQNWEGDWAIRGDFNTNTRPTQTEINGMQRWYSARQSGVTKARQQYWSLFSKQPIKINNNILPNINVYLAAEVNLVVQSMNSNQNNPFPNTIVSVIPHVEIDIISYSSYDSFCNADFEQALTYITQHHNKTNLSPTNGLYIGEFGLAQMKTPLNQVQVCIEHAVNVSYNFGCPFIMFWEVYGNQCHSCNGHPDAGNRCSAETGPDFDVNDLDGFWLIMPNFTIAWPYYYFQSLYNNYKQ